MTRSLSRQEVYPPRSHAILSRGRLSIHNMCAGPACLATSFVLNYLRMYHFLSLGNGLCCPRMAQKNRCAGIWNSRSPAARSLRLGGSLDPYLPKNTSNCGTYSEPDPEDGGRWRTCAQGRRRRAILPPEALGGSTRSRHRI